MISAGAYKLGTALVVCQAGPHCGYGEGYVDGLLPPGKGRIVPKSECVLPFNRVVWYV